MRTAWSAHRRAGPREFLQGSGSGFDTNAYLRVGPSAMLFVGRPPLKQMRRRRCQNVTWWCTVRDAHGRACTLRKHCSADSCRSRAQDNDHAHMAVPRSERSVAPRPCAAQTAGSVRKNSHLRRASRSAAVCSSAAAAASIDARGCSIDAPPPPLRRSAGSAAGWYSA